MANSALGNGTIQFLAPEEIRDTNPYSGFESDVWALGVTFYSLTYL
jgi:serine/threonine protein kinase